MLLIYVPTVRSYLNLRRAFAEASGELERELLVRRFELFASRQAAEYFDLAFAGEDGSELQEMMQAANLALDSLRASYEGEDSGVQRVEPLDHAHMRLHEIGRLAQKPAVDSNLEARMQRFRDSMIDVRNNRLYSPVDAYLAQGNSVFEDRLHAISGQLLWVPFLELEAGSARLRAGAAEAIAAASFAQHLQRLVLEYQDYAFLGEPWHKLYLARSKAEQTYEAWISEIGGPSADDLWVTEQQTSEITRGYRELNRTADRWIDLSETASKAEALSFYQTELEPMTDKVLSPILKTLLDNYQNRIDASLRSVSRRIDFAGYVLAGFALLVAVLALVSPWLMSRWIVQPVGALTLATRKLGAGDLSERVEIQSTDELGELASCFNQMVVDLKEAQEQLGRRERLVVLGQLSGSVAHEIRNPLGVMKNSIYFLRLTQKLKDEKAMQHLGLIEDEITRANNIITELLDYARDPTSQIGPMVLQEAIYRALAEIEIPESVRVEHQLEDESLTVMADVGQIERILSNLLRNAVQAMPAGGVLTTVCRYRGDEVIVEVIDTGVGITEEQIGKIFEPLYTGKAKGIGLGLPLSRRYASLNGGRIECQSEVDVGSTFRLVLPVPEGG